MQADRIEDDSMKHDALFDLTGKTALVTGASRGIGEAPRLLARQGAHVIVSSRKLDACETVAHRSAPTAAPSAIAAHRRRRVDRQRFRASAQGLGPTCS